MVWKKAETPQFFQKGEERILADKIREANADDLIRLLGGLELKEKDLVASKFGRNLVVPNTSLQGIEKIRDLSAELEEKHVVEIRCFGVGRRINERVSIVDEFFLPDPNKILITTEEFSEIVEKAVVNLNGRAIQTLMEKEREGLVRDFVKNKDVNSVNKLLTRDWDLISSRFRVTIAGKFLKLLDSTPQSRLTLDVHTHDKAIPERDMPATDDYTTVRSKPKFDWFAICKTTNIDSLKPTRLVDDLVFFYVGKESKPSLKKIEEMGTIKDENRRLRERYELSFDMYKNLRADVRTYGQILGKN
jgi:hypothetical protein